MNSKRIVALVAIAGGLAALVTSAATAGRRRVAPTPVNGPEIKAVEESGAALAAEVNRLRERLHPTSMPQRPSRNLFQFRAVPPAVRASPSLPAPVSSTVEPSAAVPQAPPMKLIGIAEDAGPDGATRTAIIAGANELFLVKEGESVTPRYRVGRILGDAVELTDLEQPGTIRLALK
jgi:hypothetical protein